MWLSRKESTCQWRRFKRHGFDPWVGKSLWSRKWQPTSVFLHGKFQGQKSLVGCRPWGHKRVGHYWATEHTPHKPQGMASLQPACGSVLDTWRRGTSRAWPSSWKHMRLAGPVVKREPGSAQSQECDACKRSGGTWGEEDRGRWRQNPSCGGAGDIEGPGRGYDCRGQPQHRQSEPQAPFR